MNVIWGTSSGNTANTIIRPVRIKACSNEFLSQPLEMKLELRHLSERAQAHVLTCQGEEGRAAQEPRLYSSAA